MNVDVKLKKLRRTLKGLKSCLLAFSGGVDSSFLLAVAHDVLGDRVLAVTALSPTYPEEDLRRAKAFTKAVGARHILIRTDELKDRRFLGNPARRCYWCKRGLYRSLARIARKNRIRFIIDGTNFDDRRDWRPGKVAADEFGIVSPLKIARLTKDDIRRSSRRMGLSEWNRPASPCLASRIPYGMKITSDRLAKIKSAEKYLRRLGFGGGLRCRLLEEGVRIEVSPTQIKKVLAGKMRKRIVQRLKALGFNYVTLDLEGFRSGSLNEVIRTKYR